MVIIAATMTSIESYSRIQYVKLDFEVIFGVYTKIIVEERGMFGLVIKHHLNVGN